MKVNAIANVLPFFIKVIIGVFLTPFMIAKLGKENYSIWLLISSFAGHYGLLTVGLSSAIRHYIAIELGREDELSIKKIFSTSFFSLFLLGASLIIFSYFFSEEIKSFLSINNETFNEAFFLFTFGFAISLINTVYKSIQAANEKFVLSNIFELGTLLFRTALVVILLFSGFGILGMVYAFIAFQALQLIINVIIHLKIFTGISFSLSNVKKDVFKSLLAFGLGTFVISIGDMLRYNLDNLVLTYYIDVSAVAIYGIGTSLVTYITQIVVSLLNVISPRLSRLVGAGQDEAMIDLFLKGLFVASTLSFGALMMGFLFGKDVIFYWVGSDFDQSYDIFLIMAFAFLLGLAQYPAISAMYSLNKHRFFGYVTIAEGVLNLILSILFVKEYGINGVVMGTLFSALTTKIFIQPIYVTRVLKLSIFRYVGAIIFPMLLVIPFAGIKLYFLNYDSMVSSSIPVMIGQMVVAGSLYLGILFILLTIFRSPYRFVMYNKRIGFISEIYYHFKLARKFNNEIKAAKKEVMIYAGGYPDSINLGDVALFRAYEKFLPEFSLVHYSEGKYNKWIVRLKRMKSKVVLGGGTLINDMSLMEATETSRLFNEFYVFGTGVAQPSFFEKVEGWKSSMNQWQNILNKAKYVGIRGPLSLSHLESHNIKAEIFGDPVLALANDTNQTISNYKKKSIGINLGGSAGRVWGSEKSIKDNFIELVLNLKDEGYDVHWFVVWQDDLPMTEEVAKAADAHKNIHCIYEDHNLYFKKVREMESFIGVKLHSVIMAHCEYVPSIMIEYRPKCLDHMASVGHERFNMRSDEVNVDALKSMINTLVENREKISKELFEKISSMKKYQEEKVEEFRKDWKVDS